MKIVMINLADVSIFPARFTIEVAEPRANPLIFSLRTRGRRDYAEFYLSTSTGAFTFASSVLWQADRETFILCLSFDPITQIECKPLDIEGKRKELGFKPTDQIGFFKVRTASEAETKDRDVAVKRIIKQNEQMLRDMQDGWQAQLDFIKSTYERKGIALKQEIQELQKSFDEFTQDSLIQSNKYKQELHRKINQAMLMGSKPMMESPPEE